MGEARAIDAAERGEALRETRQFVTFVVGDRSYGIPIGSVREIIRWTHVTPLPNQPVHARGVINLRGTIVPVNDLRARLGGSLTEATDTHVIVIAVQGEQTLGLLVDAVSDILAVATEDMKMPPAGAESAASLALVSTADDRLVTILNLPMLFEPSAGSR